MTQPNDLVTGASRPRVLLANARWALQLAWSTHPSLMAAFACCVLGRSVFPAALAVAARGLVNTTLAALGSDAPSLAPVVPWLLAGLGLTALEGLGTVATKFFSQRLRDDLNYRVTGDLLGHAAQLDLAYFEDPQAQDVLERAKQDPAEHVAKFVMELLSCVGGVLQVCSLLAILAFVEPLILLIIVLFALPYAWFQWRLSLRRYAIEHVRTTKRRWSAYFVRALTERDWVGEVRLLRLAPHLIERFRSLMGEFRDQDQTLYASELRAGSVFVLLTTLATYGLTLRVVIRVVHGDLSVGDLAIFGGAATRLRVTLESLVGLLSSILERTLHIANVTEFLAARPRTAEPAVAAHPPLDTAEIVFDDVSFSYPGSSEPALRQVSLRIAAGETIALVGENGAGKSTFVKVLARLYDPDAGAVRINGIDLRDLSRDQVCDRIAFVFQSFGRYEASAADNIAYGDWQRLLGDTERVRHVARLAGADEMLAALPQGYETRLGRTFGDIDLSGGEWQKIAVARAFAREAQILILDEPTSNLDARSEYELFVRFRQLAHGRTTIIVSHRFSTVSMADRIVVLDRGAVVEVGTHDELMARAGSYAELYQLQRPS